MYKLIAIDLDGTLLNSYGEISEENIEALRKAMRSGTEIVLASGRVLNSVLNFSKEVGELNYAISGNGSLLYNIKDQKVLYDNNIEKEKLLQIVEICEKNSIYYSIHTFDKIIAKSLNHNVLVYQNENIRRPKNRRVSIEIWPDILKYIEDSETDKFLKISICDDDKHIFSNILKKVRDIEGIDVLDVAHMSRKTIKVADEIIPIEYFYTEITNENVNKWEALKRLMGILKIEPKDVMCIGDNVNDKEMLENAGLGVAMGNSNPQIKISAKAIITDNNTNGIAKIISIGNILN